MPSAPALPRWFWPIALSMAGTAAAVLLVAPVTLMSAHGSRNYNEGWNAYYQQEAMRGEPLYGSPPGLVCNNYPPISFHLIGYVGRFTGDVNQAGRWTSLLSLVLVALVCGAIVFRLTASAPLAAYAAVSVVIWLAVYEPDRIGMNDPQLLGTVFGLLGLYAYIRGPASLRCLSLSAVSFTISVFTKHNLLAFPIGVGLHLLFRKNWKGLAARVGIGAAGSLLVLGLTRRVDGPYFFANLLMPRPHASWLANVTNYASLFQVPIAVALVWSVLHRKGDLKQVMVLILFASHVLAVAFAGGRGVDKNIFFDCILALIMTGALVFAEYGPVAAGWNRGGFLVAALLIAPSLGILITAPISAKLSWLQAKAAEPRARDFDFAVRLLKSRPGPAMCEDLLLCFEAGKPFTFDAAKAFNLVKLGLLTEKELISEFDRTGFSTVQLDLLPDEEHLEAAERLRFTTAFMQALLSEYRTEARLSGFIVMGRKTSAGADSSP